MADAEEPKKPPTAFWVFLAENRPQFAGKGGAGQVSKLAAEKWKSMSEAEKKPFEEKALTKKAEYTKALEAFKAAGGQVGKRRAEKKEKRATKKGKAEKKKATGGPKRPAGGGYGQYLAEVRADVMKNLPAGANKLTDTAKVVGQKWKALTDAERAVYTKMFAEKQAAFKVEEEKWKKEQADNGEAAAEGEEEEDDDEEDE